MPLFVLDFPWLSSDRADTRYLQWNDTALTRTRWESLGATGVEGFHGPNIPANAPFLNKLLRRVLMDKYGESG
jgi:hypothetical protein